MNDAIGNRPGRKKKVRAQEHQIRGAKYLRNIMDLLAPLHAHGDCPNRELHYDEYVAYVLLYFFTPVLDSMRGLQQASNFNMLKRKLGLRRFSLGSFSEAGSVFDPELLLPIISELVGQLDDDLGPDRFAALDRVPTAVDASLLRTLPRMVWALWRDEEHRAVKMHLHLAIPELFLELFLLFLGHNTPIALHVYASSRRPYASPRMTSGVLLPGHAAN